MLHGTGRLLSAAHSVGLLVSRRCLPFQQNLSGGRSTLSVSYLFFFLSSFLQVVVLILGARECLCLRFASVSAIISFDSKNKTTWHGTSWRVYNLSTSLKLWHSQPERELRLPKLGLSICPALMRGNAETVSVCVFKSASC